MNVNNEDERIKYLEKYFTKDGIKALEGRLMSLAELYIKETKYPFKATIFGFPALKVHSKEHLEGMIDELSQILGKLEINIEVKNDN